MLIKCTPLVKSFELQHPSVNTKSFLTVYFSHFNGIWIRVTKTCLLSNLFIWLIRTVVLILNQRNGVNFFIFSCDSFTTTTFRCYWAGSSVILWDIFTLMFEFRTKFVGVTLGVQCLNVGTFWPWSMNLKQTLGSY